MPRRIAALFTALAVAVGLLAVPALAQRPADRGSPPDAPRRGHGGGGTEDPTPTPGDEPAPSPAPGDGGEPAPEVDPETPAQTTVFPVCTDSVDGAVEFELAVDGDTRPAHGFYAVPSTDPVGTVVFSHGWGHSSYSWQHHVARVAQSLNVVAIAVDGRDLTFLTTFKAPGIPNTAGWPVSSAAVDGIAAAKAFEAACPTIDTVVNYGVSMGGNTSGIMAAAGAVRADGTPLFDWWVDVEGVNNLVETYFEARAAMPAAARMIEAETGGTFEAKPEAYRARTNVARVQDMKAAGLRGVVLVHGVDDGLVPYNQSQEMFAALNAAGIPAQFFTVTQKSTESERETSGTGQALNNVDPNYRSPLAGHASEMSTTHIVSLLGFERLDAIFAGAPPVCTRAVVVDGQLGRTPLTAC